MGKAGKIVKVLAYSALTVAIVSPFVIFTSTDKEESATETTNINDQVKVVVEEKSTKSSQNIADKSKTPTQEQKSNTQEADKIAQTQLATVDNTVPTEQVIESKEDKKELGSNEKDKGEDKAISALEKRVEHIQSQQTQEQKQAYKQSLKDRQEQVDAAVATIANNSRIYLPPLLSSRAIVVYFPLPIEFDGNSSDIKDLGDNIKVDAESGATRIENKEANITGIEYLAKKLQKETGSSIYSISTVNTYPKESSKLYAYALEEQTKGKLPELTDDIPLNIDNYDTIYLCYQNWWRDMPLAVQAFLDKYDLSGKTIIPVCLHSGDGFSSTISAIATREPHATVYRDGLLIHKQDLGDNKLRNTIIHSWLQRLGEYFNSN